MEPPEGNAADERAMRANGIERDEARDELGHIGGALDGHWFLVVCDVGQPTGSRNRVSSYLEDNHPIEWEPLRAQNEGSSQWRPSSPSKRSAPTGPQDPAGYGSGMSARSSTGCTIRHEIGRASCRERVESWGGAGPEKRNEMTAE